MIRSPNPDGFWENYVYDRDPGLIWINKTTLKELLNEHHERTVVVEDLGFSPVAVRADYPSSILFRFRVRYRYYDLPTKMTLIGKVMPSRDEIERNALDEGEICSKEVFILSNLIPKFEKILKNVNENTTFGPSNCIYHAATTHQIFMVDDLRTMDFELITGRLATFEESKACFEKLAKWHAVSHKVFTEEPKLLNSFRYKWEAEYMESDNTIDGLNLFIELLGNVPTLTQYKPFFESLRPLRLTKVRECLEQFNREPLAGSYYVLNHGDFHSKNVMFKRTPSELLCRILDFQKCYLGSPAVDILYALYMMVDADIRHNRRDELLSYYLEVFVETIKKITYNGPKPQLNDLKRQILQLKHLEFYLVYSFRPLSIGQIINRLDSLELHRNIDIRRALYKNQAYIDELHITLPQLERMGLFT